MTDKPIKLISTPTSDMASVAHQLGLRNTVRFRPAYIKPSEASQWGECMGFPTNPDENLRRLFTDLADKYRHQVRELEADIVLSAVELYGVDIRQLHQHILPDRTVYLVAGKPLVAVWRPSVIDGERYTPHRWMDVERGPTRIGMKYKLMWGQPSRG